MAQRPAKKDIILERTLPQPEAVVQVQAPENRKLYMTISSVGKNKRVVQFEVEGTFVVKSKFQAYVQVR